MEKQTTENSKTKLAWFSRLLWHSARKWGGQRSRPIHQYKLKQTKKYRKITTSFVGRRKTYTRTKHKIYIWCIFRN